MNKKQDYKRFLKIMNGLSYNFGGTLDKNGLLMQFEVLKKYSIDQVANAAVWLIKNRKEKFMPLIAEFIEVIEGKHDKPDIKSVAQIQADIAIKALKIYGSSQIETTFEHPITDDIMNVNGFGNYKNRANKMLETDFGRFRIEFIGKFKAYSEQEKFNNKIKNELLSEKQNKQLTDLTDCVLKEIN